MSISKIKATARRALHDFMGRPASYYADPRESNPSPKFIKARYHSKKELIGDMPGTNLSYAETHDRNESVVFDREEIREPRRNALVIFSTVEGYFIDNTMPPDGMTVSSEVVRADQADLVGFLAPSGEVINEHGNG